MYYSYQKLKIPIICLLLFISIQTQAQHKLVKIWESDATLAVPESVLPAGNLLYVSLVNGQALEANGIGAIAKLDRNGKIINADWVTGLNAPKGMGLWKNNLYVADISEVVVINVRTGKIKSKIPIPGAKGLNDLVFDAKGTVYVSDSELGIITSIRDGKPSPYLSGLPGANGLVAINNDLYMVTAEHLYKSDPQKKLSSLTDIPQKGADGLVALGNNNFLFTIYSGLIYYLDKSGNKQVLLDTQVENISSADIGYDSIKHIVFVPTLFKNSVVAYHLD